jgi:hypothetical protein
MYDFMDRRITELDLGAGLLVWSMRRWVMALHEQNCPCQAIGPVFMHRRITAALPYFHVMMMTFNREAREAFHFAPIGCPRISEHEALILSFICALRTSDISAFRKTMALVVHEGAVLRLVSAVAALGAILHDANLLPKTSPLQPC